MTKVQAVCLDIHVRAKDHVTPSGVRRAVLRNLHLSLPMGEIGAILGPSGCGKTTLLRIVAGLDPRFDGNIVLPPGRGGRPLRIGMVFQEPRLLPWRTVEENVRLAAPAASEARLAQLFAALDLADHRRHLPGELSLGLARRVAVARAFAIEPDLLLLDEPFASLDAPLAARLRATLAGLVGRDQVTTLLVTHDPDGAMEIADRIFVLQASPARVIAETHIELPRGERAASDLAAIRLKLLAAAGADGAPQGSP